MSGFSARVAGPNSHSMPLVLLAMGGMAVAASPSVRPPPRVQAGPPYRGKVEMSRQGAVRCSKERGWVSVVVADVRLDGIGPRELFQLLTHPDVPPAARSVKERRRYELLHSEGASRTYAAEYRASYSIMGRSGEEIMPFSISMDGAADGGGQVTMRLARPGLLRRLELEFDIRPAPDALPFQGSGGGGGKGGERIGGAALSSNSTSQSSSSEAFGGFSGVGSGGGFAWLTLPAAETSDSCGGQQPCSASLLRVTQKISPSMPTLDPVSKRIVTGINRRQVEEALEDVQLHAARHRHLLVEGAVVLPPGGLSQGGDGVSPPVRLPFGAPALPLLLQKRAGDSWSGGEIQW